MIISVKMWLDDNNTLWLGCCGKVPVMAQTEREARGIVYDPERNVIELHETFKPNRTWSSVSVPIQITKKGVQIFYGRFLVGLGAEELLDDPIDVSCLEPFFYVVKTNTDTVPLFEIEWHD